LQSPLNGDGSAAILLCLGVSSVVFPRAGATRATGFSDQ
jgi:hypothetical protein